VAQDGWTNFVKGVMSIYDMDNFRAACTKAKQIIVSRHDRKDIMELWSHRVMKEEPVKNPIADLKELLAIAKESLGKVNVRVYRAYMAKNRTEFTLNFKKCELAIAEEVFKTAEEENKLAAMSHLEITQAVERLETALKNAEANI
jgi:hypothetical protein